MTSCNKYRASGFLREQTWEELARFVPAQPCADLRAPLASTFAPDRHVSSIWVELAYCVVSLPEMFDLTLE
jgi:hypothetical protein